MGRVRQWFGGTLCLGLLAASLGGCGQSSSSKGDEDSDGAGGSSSSDGGTTSGNETASSSASGSTTSGIVPGDPVAFEDYPAEASAVSCGWLTPCCVELGLPLTAMACSATFAESARMEQASADPDNYTYDPESAGDCLATVREVYDQLGCAGGDPPAGAATRASEACYGVFQGKLEPGAACTAAIECAIGPGEDAECEELDFDTGATVCVIERRAAEGEPCYWSCTGNPTFYSCFDVGLETPAVQGKCYSDDQLYCADGVCAKQPTLGEPCTGDATCAEGYCSSATRECSTENNEGALCESDSSCSEGLYCESLDLLCTPKKANGDACVIGNECQSENCVQDKCAEATDVRAAFALVCALASGEL